MKKYFIMLLLIAQHIYGAAALQRQLPIHAYAAKGDLSKVQEIYGRFPTNLNAQDSMGNTPLARAVRGGHVSIVEYLLNNGANQDISNNGGATALHQAVGHFYSVGDRSTAAISGPEVIRSPKEMQRETADSQKLVNVLILHSSDINAQDKNGLTALHWAARQGYPRAVEALLKAGADVNALDKESKTPLHWAALKGHKEIVEILLAHGAKRSINKKDNKGRTPLHWVQRMRAGSNFKGGYHMPEDHAIALMQTLLLANADPNIRDDESKTVMDWMRQSGQSIPAFLPQGVSGAASSSSAAASSSASGDESVTMFDGLQVDTSKEDPYSYGGLPYVIVKGISIDPYGSYLITPFYNNSRTKQTYYLMIYDEEDQRVRALSWDEDSMDLDVLKEVFKQAQKVLSGGKDKRLLIQISDKAARELLRKKGSNVIAEVRKDRYDSLAKDPKAVVSASLWKDGKRYRGTHTEVKR